MTFFLAEPITACVLALGCISSPGQTTAPESSFQIDMQYVNGRADSVTLECQPPGGTHPGRVGACAVLDSVNGDFNALNFDTSECPLTYEPVDVQVKGNWYGESRSYVESYGNPCSAAASSRGVFDLS